ncbi:formate dehydrogenase accessory sulfurtransferase FdhD [Nitriliruptor alkaliphilus]|uniref:formate dehydrogenase accessory sulfurtransferase FdhD n=1 Tax=Nitriliruptor alkaliphilus TaxID=427918 RepID=UPI000A626FAE|nr:formate dehydrogenase accessory sulfurtransferase FdhD [Nitriliruptor alkaliphilus]
MGTTGLVLAGGASRRFGSDKRVAPVEGRPLLRRAVDAVAAVSDEVVVAVAPARPLPSGLALPSDVRVVTDAPGHEGPLAGLAAGLAAASHDVVVVLGGDHGWADPATLATLRDRVAGDAEVDAAVLEVDGRRQPLAAAYRRRVGEVARARLAAGELRLVALLDDLRVVTVSAPGAERTARDVDVPADLDHDRRTTPVRVTAIDGTGRREVDVVDHLAGEEPLRILVAGPGQEPIAVTTTMRTPGHELDLAVGLLHAEGIVRGGDVTASRQGDVLTDARPDDTIVVEVRARIDPAVVAERHLPATASCGVCGRASIDDLLAATAPLHDLGPTVDWPVLASLPAALRDHQRAFDVTGGLHATGIARPDGELLTVREDIGRHNALDAAIGVHVLAEEVPLTDHVVVLSGRVGFELVQKVAVAGATIIVAVGAPSDLAVRTADAVGITLCGFVRDGGGNVYTHPRRVGADPLS